MAIDPTVRLSLTRPDSHVLTRRPGVGSLTVGPVGGRDKPDLVVAPHDPVDWTVLDGMTTPAGYRWPRHVLYEGAHTSLLDWSRSRPLERATLTTTGDTVLDASGAQIQTLSVRSGTHHVTVHMPSATTCHTLVMDGDLSRMDLRGHPDGTVPGVGIVLPPVRSGSLGLPPMVALAGVTSLDVHGNPLAAPFDCRSLLQLPHLHTLTLSGALAHLDALADLPLTNLAIRFCPDLSGLPPLRTWPRLTSIIAWNVDAQVGRRLLEEIDALGPDRFSGHVGVSQLRSRRWFVEEHGMPFAAWPKGNAKDAKRLFKSASARIAKATAEATVRAAVEAFVDGIGALPGIETSEREDAAEAVRLLVSTSPVPVDAETAQAWFDAVRSF